MFFCLVRYVDDNMSNEFLYASELYRGMKVGFQLQSRGDSDVAMGYCVLNAVFLHRYLSDFKIFICKISKYLNKYQPVHHLLSQHNLQTSQHPP